MDTQNNHAVLFTATAKQQKATALQLMQFESCISVEE
jgi:hypothetical protein